MDDARHGAGGARAMGLGVALLGLVIPFYYR